MYYGGTTVTCFGDWKNTTTTCPTNRLDDASKTLIDNHTWNTGAPNYKELYNSTTETLDTVEFYKAERGNETGKICNGGDYCNDTVERTTEWTGYVALPYATDWAYASSESDCETNMFAGYDATASSFGEAIANMTCKKNNWMHYGSTLSDAFWVLSPDKSFESSFGSLVVYGIGAVSASLDGTAEPHFVIPSIYLKNNVQIISGTGTSGDPYILKLDA